MTYIVNHSIMAIPQEIVDIIIDEVADEPNPVLRLATLKTCSLTSRSWVHRSQERLFSILELNEIGFRTWCANIRPGANGPSRHVIQLRFTQEFEESYADDLALTTPHMASFANLQVLHLIYIPLQREQVRSGFGKLGPTVSRLSLERCEMDIDSLASFLHPFTNLQYLSLLDPRIVPGTKPQHPLQPLSTKGSVNLELRVDLTRFNERSFVHELSRLPLSARTVTFLEPPSPLPWNYDQSPRTTEARELLLAARETLTRLTIRARRFPSPFPSHTAYRIRNSQITLGT